MKKSEILTLHFAYEKETKNFYVYKIASEEAQLFHPEKLYLSKQKMETNLPKLTLTFYSGG